jgi:ligand-binding SRPBCC domain-containing protein
VVQALRSKLSLQDRGHTLFTVSDTIHVHAPIERCFLLSTNIQLVEKTLGMHPVGGKTEGMVVGGDRLLWGGWKFCLPQLHESLITRYEQPEFFQDTMQRGRFKRFQHDHNFIEIDGQTLLTDKLRFSMRLGWLGKKVAQYVMVPYISKLLRRRMELLKQVAESDEWRRYLPDEGNDPSCRGEAFQPGLSEA